MPKYSEYFSQTGYKPTYQIGDRVTGRWKQIPFTGTVGNDRLVSNEIGPEISVHLDIPVRHQDHTYQIIFVKHTDLRLLK